jgi:hypothetical protein
MTARKLNPDLLGGFSSQAIGPAAAVQVVQQVAKELGGYDALIDLAIALKA